MLQQKFQSNSQFKKVSNHMHNRNSNWIEPKATAIKEAFKAAVKLQKKCCGSALHGDSELECIIREHLSEKFD